MSIELAKEGLPKSRAQTLDVVWDGVAEAIALVSNAILQGRGSSGVVCS